MENYKTEQHFAFSSLSPKFTCYSDFIDLIERKWYIRLFNYKYATPAFFYAGRSMQREYRFHINIVGKTVRFLSLRD